MPVRRRSRNDLRAIPSVDETIRSDSVRPLIDRHGRAVVIGAVREVLGRLREEALRGQAPPATDAEIGARIGEAIRLRTTSSLRRVINATGVIVHTNLGRARIPDAARLALDRVAGAPVTLEYDLAAGARGSRSAHLRRPLSLLFPDHAALAVNNNAAAVLLALNTLAEGREVVISRGELVEIGGSFRIPEIMAKSGARLREVGSTNRTRIGDYAAACGASTGMILKVHTSNYRIVGFTEETGIPALADLARRHGCPLMVDQGSGCLRDAAVAGVREEPTVEEILRQGADLVTFSADKMLGGPQAGLAVGRPELVDRMTTNPLFRALRLDKLAMAALEATLDLWARGEEAEEIPTWRMILTSREEIARRAEALRERLVRRLGEAVHVDLRDGASRVGGGAAPMQDLPTVLIRLRPAEKGIGAAAWEERIRGGDPPVIACVRDEALLIDPRTVDPDEESDLVEAIARGLGPADG